MHMINNNHLNYILLKIMDFAMCLDGESKNPLLHTSERPSEVVSHQETC